MVFDFKIEDIETRNYIDGEFVDAEAHIKLYNPYSRLFTVAVCNSGHSDVEAAFKAASRAQPSWAALDAGVRAEYLQRFADLIERDVDYLAYLESLCTGKPVRQFIDHMVCSSIVRFYAGLASSISGTSSLATPGYLSMSLRMPYGVTAGIIPWNTPMRMFVMKVAPAILSGNTIIIKASEKSPLSPLHMAKLLDELGLPRGVVNVINGDGLSGSLLASHMGIRKLAFTGSTATARKIKKAAAESNLKNVTIEAGGKGPLVVFADGNIDRAAKNAAESIAWNMGQICIATTRIYVHSSVKDVFLDKYKSYLEAAYSVSGDPFDERVGLGPLADVIQYERVQGMIQESVEQGHEHVVVDIPHIDDNTKKLVVQPRLVISPPRDSEIAREEVFGPVSVLDTFETLDEAIRLCNDSEYGLYSSAFTKDLSTAMQFVKAIESGIVGVNTTSPFLTSYLPFGGVKQSGDGRECGLEGLYEWTEVKSVYINME